MGLEQLPEIYVGPSEAAKILGMTRDQFNHYVKRGIFEGTKIIGDVTYFSRRDIEMRASLIQAAMMAGSTPQLRFEKATLETQKQELELAVLNFGKRTRDFHQARIDFLKKNPDMSYYVFDRKYLAASINILPIDHEGIELFRKGTRGWHLYDHIEQFTPSKKLECIIIDMMTTTAAPPEQRKRYAMHLLIGLRNLFEEWAEKGIEITNVYACGGTTDGREILENAGFKIVEMDDDMKIEKKRIIYELDIDRSDLPLLKPYKEVLAKLQQNSKE